MREGEAVSGLVGIGGGIRRHSEGTQRQRQRALRGSVRGHSEAAHLSCVALSTSARKPDDSTARASMMARSAELRAARAAALTPPAAKADRTVAVGGWEDVDACAEVTADRTVAVGGSRGGGGGGGGA